MSEIRVLTLWQPWASLIALRLKRYETRSWGTGYRGKLAIHAAQRPINKDEILHIKYAVGGGGTSLDQLEKLDRVLDDQSLPLGAIVAIADLTDCFFMQTHRFGSTTYIRTPKTGHIFIDQQNALEIAVGNWQVERFAWLLDCIYSLDKPIPYKGAQGLRKLNDAAVLTAIAAQINIGQEVASAAT